VSSFRLSLFLSYRVILPSSFNIILSIALVLLYLFTCVGFSTVLFKKFFLDKKCFFYLFYYFLSYFLYFSHQFYIFILYLRGRITLRGLTLHRNPLTFSNNDLFFYSLIIVTHVSIFCFDIFNIFTNYFFYLQNVPLPFFIIIFLLL